MKVNIYCIVKRCVSLAGLSVGFPKGVRLGGETAQGGRSLGREAVRRHSVRGKSWAPAWS